MIANDAAVRAGVSRATWSGTFASSTGFQGRDRHSRADRSVHQRLHANRTIETLHEDRHFCGVRNGEVMRAAQLSRGSSIPGVVSPTKMSTGPTVVGTSSGSPGLQPRARAATNVRREPEFHRHDMYLLAISLVPLTFDSSYAPLQVPKPVLIGWACDKVRSGRSLPVT
jgi:hypothetical protein